jgi:ketosteroid isomerase-like protein
MPEQPASKDVHAELTVWFEAWGGCVAAVDYAAARPLFDAGVIGFGTRMEYVAGLDNLEQQQWRSVWGTIEGFTFLTERLISGVSPDGRLAYGLVPWSSTGFHEDGKPFERPGRATVLFTRGAPGEGWRAIHTHISLDPGTPQRSYGNRPARS